MGAWEMPEVVLGTWEGAQEEFVRCRDPRVVWSPLLARFEAAPSREVGKGSAGLPNFAAVASLLQIQGVQGNGSLKQFGAKAAAWVRDVGLVLSSSFATPPRGACTCGCFAASRRLLVTPGRSVLGERELLELGLGWGDQLLM